MKNKWLYFKSSHSPVEIMIHAGRANISADWRRLQWDFTFIDGQLLSKIMRCLEIDKESLNDNKGNNTRKQVLFVLRNFFSTVLLKKYDNKKKDTKEKFLDALMKTFHQGGLLHPVSAGMIHVLKDEMFAASAAPQDHKKQINIKTSKEGFTIQEIYTVKKCLPMLNTNDEYLAQAGHDGILLPDPGEDYVFQAQATIEVFFSAETLITKVINNTMNYGNKYVKNRADKRSWLDKLIDFIRNLFSANSVLNLAHESFSLKKHWSMNFETELSVF